MNSFWLTYPLQSGVKLFLLSCNNFCQSFRKMPIGRQLLRVAGWQPPLPQKFKQTGIILRTSVAKLISPKQVNPAPSRDDLAAEVLALKHKSRILRQNECPRILLSCYRARNSGSDITSPKVMLLLLFRRTLSFPIYFEQNPLWN